MKQRHDRLRVALLCLFLLVAPLFSMFIHGRQERSQTALETILIHATAPGQDAMHTAFSSLVAFWKQYIYLVDVEEQNNLMRDEVERLKLMASRAGGLEDENRRLQEMLGFREEHTELRLVSARIIARETSPFFNVSRVKIDRGSEDQVCADMPVMTASGLVGRIEKVSGGFCDVMLLTDSRSKIDAQVPGKGVSGVLVGTGDNLPVFRFPFQKNQLTRGDLLLTTGHDRIFPKGLALGYMASETPKQVGTQLECAVEPAVRFPSVQEVFVAVPLSRGGGERASSGGGE
jgi:rod shape-determining protein MreC